MKRIVWLSLVLALVSMSVAACVPKGAPAASPEGASLSPFNENYENALPELTQLMIGTLKLEETDNAVDAALAAELLPLWKAYRTLGQSDTASEIETDALFEQILETMSGEQLNAIAAMELTGQDMASVMQAQGLGGGAQGRFGDMSPEQIATMQAQRAAGGGQRGGGGGFPGGGGPPGGGFPGGGMGGGMGGGQSPNPEQIATLRAQRGGTGGFAMQGPLFDALVKFLESKA